jgi:pimeloyl-ACP methyl ester carboxylesterase
MRQSSHKQQFITLFLLTSVLFGNFSAMGQTKRGNASGGQTASNQKSQDKKECKGGYTGVVTYNRTIKQNHPGQYGSFFNRTYTYDSTISIRDDGRTQGSIYPQVNGISGSFNFSGAATASQSETMDDKKVSEKDDYCKLTLKGAAGKTRVHCESEQLRNAKAAGTGDVNVFLSFKGDKYTISLDNPKIAGQWTSKSDSHCAGTCGADKPLNSSDSGAFTDSEAGTYTDDMPFDPANFNRLSGTFTRNRDEETVTITWNLSRCAPPLQIDNLEFEHHVYPDASKWQGIDSMVGTTDGNVVKVKAKVFNNGGETAYATVKFSETTSNEQLPNGTVSVAVKPGENRDVEYEWDTNGYSWDDDKRPKPNREIKAEIEGADEAKTAKIKILPKPVIMAHGLWSNAAAWAAYPGYLREAHSFAWKGYAVGSDPEHGKMNTGDHPGNSGATNTVYQNAQEEGKQIEYTRQKDNAWHVDIVAHSMGGLISRQYINSMMPPVFDGKPAVTHLVMLGTPNQGSPCADTVNQVFEDHGYNDMQAMRELRPIIVRAFNARVTDKKGVRFSILIGAFMPRTCLSEGLWGDGVVPLDSAKYNNTDYRYVFRNHIDLTGEEDFKGFVLPRLAVGPKKAKAEQTTAQIDNNVDDNAAAGVGDVYQKQPDRYGYAKYFQNVSFKRNENRRNGETDDSQKNVTTRQKIDLQAKETKEVEIPVTDGSYAGIVLVGPVAVGATLTDEGGTAVGESKAGPEAMKDLFRTIGARRPITKGVWKLKLENLGSEPATVFVAGFTGNDSSEFTVEAGKPNGAGNVPLVAKWAVNGAPVTIAKITGNVVGQNSQIEFFDDGKHGDGAPGDGVYGALTEKLEDGDYSVEAKAETNNQTALAVANFNIGGAAPGAKTIVPAVNKTIAPRRGITKQGRAN